MWPSSTPSKHTVLSLNSTRPSHRRRRRLRLELQLERLEERQLLSGSASSSVVPTTSFIKQDTTTQGTWIGTYGAQGYDVIGNAASLPSYATVTPSGQASYTWAASTTDPRALQDASGSGRIAACWYSATSFTVDVNLTDGQTHDLELYFLDWDSTARSETVQISNASTGAVLNTETVTSFHSGVYLDWAVSGNVDITVTHWPGPTPSQRPVLRPACNSGTDGGRDSPASGATGVATNTESQATFNEAVQASSITTTTFTLKNSSGTAVAATVAYNSSTDTATLTPSAALAYGTTYTATVSGAKNTAGVAMSSKVTWSFTTATSNSSTLTVSAGSNLTTNAGSTVTFAGSVSGGTAPYTDSWNFGDGSTSTGNSASFTRPTRPLRELDRGLWRCRLQCDRVDLELPLVRDRDAFGSDIDMHLGCHDLRRAWLADSGIDQPDRRVLVQQHVVHDRRESDRRPGASGEPLRGGLGLDRAAPSRFKCSMVPAARY